MVELVVEKLLVAGTVAAGRGRKSAGGRGRNAGFLAYFGPDFLLPLTIKSDSIYRLWKRAILSTLGKNFSP